MPQPKQKVSLSLPADLVTWIDHQAARERATRSGVVEQAVRGWARRSAAKDIEHATVAYYQAMTASERHEDDAWSRAGAASWSDED